MPISILPCTYDGSTRAYARDHELICVPAMNSRSAWKIISVGFFEDSIKRRKGKIENTGTQTDATIKWKKHKSQRNVFFLNANYLNARDAVIIKKCSEKSFPV